MNDINDIIVGNDAKKDSICINYRDCQKVMFSNLKGNFLLQRPERKGHALAVDYFEKAVRIDPEYAPAWAGLSVGYT